MLTGFLCPQLTGKPSPAPSATLSTPCPPSPLLSWFLATQPATIPGGSHSDPEPQVCSSTCHLSPPPGDSPEPHENAGPGPRVRVSLALPCSSSKLLRDFVFEDVQGEDWRSPAGGGRSVPLSRLLRRRCHSISLAGSRPWLGLRGLQLTHTSSGRPVRAWSSCVHFHSSNFMY